MEQRHCKEKNLILFFWIFTAFYIAYFTSSVVYLFIQRGIDNAGMQLMVYSGLFLSVVYVTVVLGVLRTVSEKRCTEVNEDASKQNVNPEIMKKEVKTLIKECLSEAETAKRLAREASKKEE